MTQGGYCAGRVPQGKPLGGLGQEAPVPQYGYRKNVYNARVA